MRTGATEKATYAQNGYSSHLRHLRRRGEPAARAAAHPGSRVCPSCPLPIPGLDALAVLAARPDLRAVGHDHPELRTHGRGRRAGRRCQIPAQLAALVELRRLPGLPAASSAPPARSSRRLDAPRSATSSCSAASSTISGVTTKVDLDQRRHDAQGQGQGDVRHPQHRRPGVHDRAGRRRGRRPVRADPGPARRPGQGALATLGVTITVPEPTFEKDGKEIKSIVEALIVEIDTATLSDALRQLPLEDILDQLPEEMKDLKKVLQAGDQPLAAHRASTSAGRRPRSRPPSRSTIPDVVPDNDPRRPRRPTDGWHLGRRRHDRRHSAAPPAASRRRPPRRPDRPDDHRAPCPPAELASGLPPLFSIPSLLLFGALGGAIAGRQLRPPDGLRSPSAAAVRARTASTPACPTCERSNA